MLPGPCRIVKCPYCGKKKELMSLRTGNNLVTELWSDGKLINPMLPSISFVQKCPQCKKFYLPDRLDAIYAKDGRWTMERGLLDFYELQKALNALAETITTDEQYTIRMMLLHAYNDNEQLALKNGNELFFRENIHWLLEHWKQNEDNLWLKAELYRELGDFDTAEEILTSYSLEGNLEYIRQRILEMVQSKNSKVFRITSRNTNYRAEEFTLQNRPYVSNHKKKNIFQKWIDRLCSPIFSDGDLRY